MNANQVNAMLTVSWKTRQPLFILGKPGIGKSAVVKAFADANGLGFVDMRLLFFDPVDLRGLPVRDGETTRWLVPSFLPKSGKGILFLDEANAAVPAVQACAYQLTLDRKLGEYQLPEGWIVVLAGNNNSDKGVAHRIPSPLVSRCKLVQMSSDLQAWARWATENDVRPEVIAFCRVRPELLNNFDGKTWVADSPYACERQWVNVSNHLDACEELGCKAGLEEIASMIGTDAATQFLAFVQQIESLPSIESILKAPKTAKIPDNNSGLYAVSTALAHHVSPETFDKALTYLRRLPREFEVLGVQDCAARKPEITQTDGFVSWASDPKNAKILI